MNPILLVLLTILLGFSLFYLVLRIWFIAPLKQVIGGLSSILKGAKDVKVPLFQLKGMNQLAGVLDQSIRFLFNRIEQTATEKEEIFIVVKNMVEQVIAVDLSGKILLMNPSAEKLFDAKMSESAGKPSIEVIRKAPINELIRFVLDNEKEKFEEVRLFLEEEKIFEAKAVPIRSEGRMKGALLVLHDITRIHRLEQIRKEFVANVSHELRTPLTTIRGFAETLLSGALSDSQHNREFIETIQTEAERLTRLVDEILNLSSIESGKKKMQWNSVSVPDLLREVRESLKPLAQKHGVAVQLNLSSNPPPLRADAAQLKQVFMNLVENAIKFNKKEGQVIMEAFSNGHSLTVSIRDTGIGIPEKDLPRIFERFYRVDKARSSELGGTGLGLAIVKHIVEAHNGSVQVESAPQGSSFFVSLPY